MKENMLGQRPITKFVRADGWLGSRWSIVQDGLGLLAESSDRGIYFDLFSIRINHLTHFDVQTKVYKPTSLHRLAVKKEKSCRISSMLVLLGLHI